MRLRNLFTPSFRNRLRLFFVVIVVIPMIAVAAVLFQIVTRSEESQTDAQLSEAQRVAIFASAWPVSLSSISRNSRNATASIGTMTMRTKKSARRLRKLTCRARIGALRGFP